MTVRMPVGLRRAWIVAAIVVALALGAVVLLAGGDGSSPTPAKTASAPVVSRYARAVAALSPRELAAAFGTEPLDAGTLTRAERERVDAVTELSYERLAAAYGTGRQP